MMCIRSVKGHREDIVSCLSVKSVFGGVCARAWRMSVKCLLKRVRVYVLHTGAACSPRAPRLPLSSSTHPSRYYCYFLVSL